MGLLKLVNLGVMCGYNPEEPGKLHYDISIDPEKLEDPGKAKKHFTRIINAVSKDASKKGGLDNLTLSVSQEYHENLLSTAQDLLSKAREQRNAKRDFGNAPMVNKVLLIGGAVVGGIAGLVFGYDQMTTWATNAAEYLNNESHLLAPVAGLTQAGISIIGTAATTALGALGGGFGLTTLAHPYWAAKTPLAKKVREYASLEQALSNAETILRETE